MNVEVSRRSFIKGSAASGTLLLGFSWTSTGAAVNTDNLFPTAWVKITPDNKFIFYLDKAEMGQGVMTSLAMILAEELEIEPDELAVEHAMPGRSEYKHAEFGMQITGGSTSVRVSWEPLRQAGAVTREMLKHAAAKRWNTGIGRVRARAGRVWHQDSKDSFSYGELAGDAAKLDVPAKVPLKDPKDFRLIGRSVQRLDAHAKVTGTATFGIDAGPPGVLVAQIIRSPYIGGKLKSFDATEALKRPGIKHVVEVSSGVAVVGEKFWQVKMAIEAVETKWEKTESSSVSSDKLMERFRQAGRSGSATDFTDRGDVDEAMQQAGKTLTAEYEIPYMAHATMEPMNCTAHVTQDACEIWAPTQAAGIGHVFAAEITGLDLAQVKLYPTLMGGGFGRRLNHDYIVDAVETSQQVKAPVKVMMSRQDDMRHDVYRPGNYHALAAGLDEAGKPVAWKHLVVGPSVMAQVVPRWAYALVPEWMPGFMRDFAGWTAENLLEITQQDQTSVEGAADMEYEVPHMRVSYVLDDPGVPIGFWRSVGHSYTGFVVESFIDELAHLAGQDPFEYRRTLLARSPQRKKVLELAAEKSGWGGPLPEGVGRGIAQVFSFGSYAAQVAEVELTPDRTIRVKRVVCAFDCGLAINPDQVRAQVESGIIFGLSAALKDAITFQDGEVMQSNFHDYRVLRMNETPDIEVHLVESGHKPRGAGEPAVPPVAAAVANAVFSLTGQRLRQLPLRLPTA